jgi:predicted transcriptional regulator of viral defense system
MAKRQPSKIEALLHLSRRGPVRTRDLAAAGIPRSYLGRLVARGQLEHVDRGLYRAVDGDFTEQISLVEVCKRVPGGVICLLSALQFHTLTSEAPHAVWLLIERGARAPSFTQPRIVVIRASGAALHHGVDTHLVEGVPVRVTSPAKTVADCFRYRRHVGLEVALTALRDYLRKYRGGVDALLEAARADRVYSVLYPYLEALV